MTQNDMLEEIVAEYKKMTLRQGMIDIDAEVDWLRSALTRAWDMGYEDGMAAQVEFDRISHDIPKKDHE